VKIVRIIARLNVGGPARHVVWLTAGLKREGYETVLVSGVVPPGEDDMGYFAAQAGVEPLIIPEMSREISARDAVTIWKVFRLMRRERPDIVCTHTAKAGAVGRVAGFMYRWLTPAALVGRPRSCHFVHTYHGHIFHGYYGSLRTGLFLRIERLLARFVSDRIVVLSQQQRREINEEFRVGRAEQFVVLPLGIDLNLYAGWRERRSLLRDELKASDDEILIGIVGRLADIKNHDLFLQAAARLKVLRAADSPKVRFIVIGDGSLRSALEAQAKSLGLTDEVVFLGTRTDPENFYPALDIVALTSRNEGSPLTLIEGMANARPVIATAVGGVVDLVGPPSVDLANGPVVCARGMLVESGDAEGFAQGLAMLIGDESLRQNLGRIGREYVLEHHAKERLVEDMRGLYDQLYAGETVSAGALAAKGK